MDTVNLTKVELRAHQIWAVLLLAARNRQTITYGMLGKFVGGIGAHHFGRMLAVVARYCEEKRYPPLTVIVVSKNSGKPSEDSGFPKDSNLVLDSTVILKRTQDVFLHPWDDDLLEDGHPDVEDFHRVWERTLDMSPFGGGGKDRSEGRGEEKGEEKGDRNKSIARHPVISAKAEILKNPSIPAKAGISAAIAAFADRRPFRFAEFPADAGRDSRFRGNGIIF